MKNNNFWAKPDKFKDIEKPCEFIFREIGGSVKNRSNANDFYKSEIKNAHGFLILLNSDDTLERMAADETLYKALIREFHEDPEQVPILVMHSKLEFERQPVRDDYDYDKLSVKNNEWWKDSRPVGAKKFSRVATECIPECFVEMIDQYRQEKKIAPCMWSKAKIS